MPGPGNYQQVDPSKYKEQAPKYSIKGSGGHDFGAGLRDAPGPGQYSTRVEPIKERAPAYTIGGKKVGNLTAEGPGPGAYNGNAGSHITGGVMGARPDGKFNAEGPGPGQYGVGSTFDK